MPMPNDEADIERWLLSRGAVRVPYDGEAEMGFSRWRVPGHEGAVHDGAAPVFHFTSAWKDAGSPRVASASSADLAGSP